MNGRVAPSSKSATAAAAWLRIDANSPSSSSRWRAARSVVMVNPRYGASGLPVKRIAVTRNPTEAQHTRREKGACRERYQGAAAAAGPGEGVDDGDRRIRCVRAGRDAGAVGIRAPGAPGERRR